MRDGAEPLSHPAGLRAAWGSEARNWFAANQQNAVLLLSLVLVMVVMAAFEPRFLTFDNLINIARQISINLIIAVGMTFCMITGGFDLSVGSVAIMSGVVAAMVMLATGSVALGLLAGLAVGVLAGLANGLLITRLKVNALVATLGMMVFARGVALILTGGDVIIGLPSAFNWIGVGFVGPAPVPVFIAAIVTAIGWYVLSKTEYGLNCYAVGGNRAAATLAGLRPNRVETTAYVVQGFLAAVGGIVLTARVVSAQPALMHNTNLDVIAAVVVGGTRLGGGKGTMGGTVLGVVLLGALFNGLNIIGVGYEWQLCVIGVIVVAAVAFDSLTQR